MSRRPSLPLGTSFQTSARDYLLQRYIQLHGELDNTQRRSSSSSVSPVLSPLLEDSPSLFAASRRSSDTSTDQHDSIASDLSPTFPSVPPALPAPLMRQQDPPGQQDEEGRACGITSQIKATLTELLNLDDVKCNDQVRHWVQDRLHDAELELKSQRRRSRRKSNLDLGTLNAIAASMKGSTDDRP